VSLISSIGSEEQIRAMESTRRKLLLQERVLKTSGRHQKHLFKSSSPEADVIRGSEDHQKLKD